MHKNESQRSAQEALAHNDARTWVLAGACRPLRRDDAVHADVVDLRAVPGAGADPANALAGALGVRSGTGDRTEVDNVRVDRIVASKRPAGPGEDPGARIVVCECLLG